MDVSLNIKFKECAYYDFKNATDRNNVCAVNISPDEVPLLVMSKAIAEAGLKISTLVLADVTESNNSSLTCTVQDGEDFYYIKLNFNIT